MGFRDLMPHRIHEILLVSSAYDAFILSEDGHLSERLSQGFAALQLTAPPRISQVQTAKQALALLPTRRFDLVLVGVGLGDQQISVFAEMVKHEHPTLPVVVLTFGEADLLHCPGGFDPKFIDRVFLWTGDAQILIALVKLIEDTQNVYHDTQISGVQVILVVEDSVRRYSSFLSLLYGELLKQSASMSAEGLNEEHKRTRMRARPKILLATTWEDAVKIHEHYREHMMALISDVDFPRDGTVQSAGFDLVTRVRANDARLPVLLQSANAEYKTRAAELNTRWAHKNSPRLLATLRSFMRLELGFGDFIFRLPTGEALGQIIGHAADIFELEHKLRDLPEESLRYHADGDHFSTWLNTRGMFRLARALQPKRIDEFGGLNEIRHYLISKLREARHSYQEGRIVDISAYSQGSDLVRLGQGSLGGKGRGVAFLHTIVARHKLRGRYPGLEIRTPRTVIIGTDEFQRFLDTQCPPPALLAMGCNDDILRCFLDADLADDLVSHLRTTLADLDGPLAVRSSSLLEDSRFQPFAGVYDTWMLANDHPDLEHRLAHLCDAIRAVWASTYFEGSRAYFRGTPQSVEEEHMGIVIQQVVGTRHGRYFYPDIAGVGQSRNYYPVLGQAAEDGVVLMAVGLGHAVVSGGRTFRFCPKYPEATQTQHNASDMVADSQSQVRVLDLQHTVNFRAGCESNLGCIDLSEAEEHGSLRAAASVYALYDDIIRDDLSLSGPRIITFNNILKWKAFPLAQALADTLKLLRRAMGDDVEIEFALDLGDWGKMHARKPRRLPQLYLLQVRHMATRYHGESALDLEQVAKSRVICRTDSALGDGLIDGIADIIYVSATDLHAKTTPGVALQVAQANAMLQAADRPYILIGPGRWGTSDPGLGLPVQWTDIAGARVIIETPFGTRSVAPSQGTHFFHNITSLGVGYLTISESAEWDFIDRDWLSAQPSIELAAGVHHIQLEHPLQVHLQGCDGRAALLKPAPPEDMSELQSKS
jgi:hypothetical protein